MDKVGLHKGDGLDDPVRLMRNQSSTGRGAGGTPALRCGVGLAVCLAVFALPASAWWPKGHSIVAEAAVRALPVEVPAFFRAGSGAVAHLSQDPDVAKNPGAPNARDDEEPEHYLDFELLGGRTLPPTRYAFHTLCVEAKLDAKDIGLLPYAVTGWTERLAVAFAEHRKWPEDPHIRTKCLFYAGILAHYSGDLSQPLHCTIHYNGRARPDGTSPRTGIHERVDSLIERVSLKAEELAKDQRAVAYPQIMPAVIEEIHQSRALIDRVYELEPQLPPRGDGAVHWKPTPEVAAFTLERARSSVRFTASLYLTAWRKSAAIRLPPWLER